MTDITDELRQRVEEVYGGHGTVLAYPDDLCARAATEIERLRTHVRCLLDNDPDDDAADGVSVLDVWRKHATEMLDIQHEPREPLTPACGLCGAVTPCGDCTAAGLPIDLLGRSA